MITAWDPRRGSITQICPESTPPADTDQVVDQLWCHSSQRGRGQDAFIPARTRACASPGASCSGLCWSKAGKLKPTSMVETTNALQADALSWRRQQCACEDGSASTWDFSKQRWELWEFQAGKRAWRLSTGSRILGVCPTRFPPLCPLVFGAGAAKSLTTIKTVFTARCLAST